VSLSGPSVENHAGVGIALISIATVEGGRSMAIEMELQAKSPERLRAVLGMYLEWLGDGRVDTVLYVAGIDAEDPEEPAH
jgi:hypothetical protein